MTTASQSPKQVGLLFVHGIGEQKRFDHLRASVVEFAELMRQADDGPFSCAVTDRTKGWELPPGDAHPHGLSPITLRVTGPKHDVEFHCHEVWWADLAEREGIFDAIGFWIWGFGQWAAPIYRELDPSGLEKAIDVDKHRTSTLVKLPKSVAGDLRVEPVSRLQLAVAGLIAMLTAATWSLAKRLLQKLLAQAPSPVLIVRYVGDVRTYEERAVPGASALSDPGHPRRVGIRRRMVAEMVAMGANDKLDRWYVVAHSQGTVLAYNGLTEIGHALPNYLTEAQWKAVPLDLKSDFVTRRRPNGEIGAMMPARPPWLADTHIISRPKLFAKLQGFLTYGSPLNKFAGLWPRVVATATDVGPEDAPTNPFPKDCRWINLQAPQDPVAGTLSAFARPIDPTAQVPGQYTPPLETVETVWGFDYLLAHIRYFTGTEGFDRSAGAKQRRRVVRWLIDPLDPANQPVEIKPYDKALKCVARWLHMYGAYLFILALFLLVTSGMVTAAGGLAKAVLGGKAASFASVCDFGWATLQAYGAVTVAAAATVLFAGLVRWVQESKLNRKLAEGEAARAVTRHDRADDICGKLNQARAHRSSSVEKVKAEAAFQAARRVMAESLAEQRYWAKVRKLHVLQYWAAILTGLLSVAALVWGGRAFWLIARIGPDLTAPASIKTLWAIGQWVPMLLLITLCYAITMFVQTGINASIKPLSKQKDQTKKP
ncbi:MAG: hypothetical protein K2W81_06265 [Sphingomonas sp.]|uniref:hypothetical protein n=1 Tax=Sphingomonas sp. TaxID=28214 RepID=UPI0025DB3241|nr:hypothetical protein [Sphingomonas sp.]MBY0283551.1 hypothetical protein [Sphingomonas sp.]